MKYHANLQFGSDTHCWWNHTKESLIRELVIPFVNGQIVLVNRGGSKHLMNMKNVTLLAVYKTKSLLEATDEKSIVDQIEDDEFIKNDCTEEILSEIKVEETSFNMTSLLEKALQPSKQQVFVIMKFGDDLLDSAYEGAYKATVEQFDLHCLRIDEVQDSGKITDQILEKIAESKYVIADLSGNRPNCYYELGFAHALGKELILSVHENESVHFDLAGYRFIQWKTESELRKKLKQRLEVLENNEGRSN